MSEHRHHYNRITTGFFICKGTTQLWGMLQLPMLWLPSRSKDFWPSRTRFLQPKLRMVISAAISRTEAESDAWRLLLRECTRPRLQDTPFPDSTTQIQGDCKDVNWRIKVKKIRILWKRRRRIFCGQLFRTERRQRKCMVWVPLGELCVWSVI